LRIVAREGSSRLFTRRFNNRVDTRWRDNHFLWNLLQQEQPKVIIECGAGLSTLVLARGLETHGFGSSNSRSLVSLEQNLAVKKVVETRLQRCGLDRHVNVMHSPLSRRGEYQLDPNMLRAHLGSDKADWIALTALRSRGRSGVDASLALTVLPSRNTMVFG
jgi:hypothetical protein